MTCAGHYRDADYPKSKPDHLRKMPEAKKPAAKAKAPKVKMPRKGQRRSMELWYESQGKVAPWLERPQQEGS